MLRVQRWVGAVVLAGWLSAPALARAAPADAPAAFGVADRATILTVHGVGAQIYACKPGPDGVSQWAFREPIAALFKDGRTVGRHYAGPTWALTDDATLKGKTTASAPGATPGDAPLLKLDVIERQGGGAMKDVAVILRLNTHGGVLKGACGHAGDLRAEPYSADYVFLK